MSRDAEREKLLAQLYGELSRPEEEELAARLHREPGLQAALDAERRTLVQLELLRGEEEAAASSGALAAAALRRGFRPAGAIRRPGFFRGAAAAALLAAAGIALWLAGGQKPVAPALRPAPPAGPASPSATGFVPSAPPPRPTTSPPPRNSFPPAPPAPRPAGFRAPEELPGGWRLAGRGEEAWVYRRAGSTAQLCLLLASPQEPTPAPPAIACGRWTIRLEAEPPLGAEEQAALGAFLRRCASNAPPPVP